MSSDHLHFFLILSSIIQFTSYMKRIYCVLPILLLCCFLQPVQAQEYFFKDRGPFDPSIPTPEQFLGYPIGSHHTRYDRIVAYFQELARLSDKASFSQYGMTHEHRPLIMLTVTDPAHQTQLEAHKARHLQLTDPNGGNVDVSNLPIFVNLGYNVHGNEPSSSEAAILTAYTLVASQSDAVKRYLSQAVIFIDPTINPDGRDRHTHWANMYKGEPLVSDPMDAEHNEGWPRGRTNHYWFDLNRDWLLGVHPESKGKLNWYHEWYPNVVTDFHEMGTNSTYFFEPMKANASKDPIMPVENYTTLNDAFARYYTRDLDAIGSFYFTKEVFDGTYPGYGSSYPDLQGGLGILFEQASSRGHVQETPTGDITFPFTIRNQYTSSLATVEAAVDNKDMLHRYQREFFTSALSRAAKNPVKGYVFGDPQDQNRTRAFIDKLLLHRIQVYKLPKAISRAGKNFSPDFAYVVPSQQPQYRMVQTMFETYKTYTDSVFYDASAWSMANFFNMPYASLSAVPALGEQVTQENNVAQIAPIKPTSYAYLLPWDEYNAPAALYYLQKNGVNVLSAFKPFTLPVEGNPQKFSYGTLLIPVSRQRISADSLQAILSQATQQFKVEAYAVSSGYSSEGVDLGSAYFRPLEIPKALMLIDDGVSSYEAGEVWHLLDTRVGMPITKLAVSSFDRMDLNKYNTLVMVSGNYNQLDSAARQRLANWVKMGNTLITIREASAWAVKQQLVQEQLVDEIKKKEQEEQEKTVPKLASTERLPYVDAPEMIGRNKVGGAIFEVDLDITHPLGFGYHSHRLPVYRNSEVWLAPSKNEYATVAKYTENPHIDGFITEKNLQEFLKPSASLLVSKLGSGRVVMFADNPNFRGAWYGTNRLFLNALFLGQHIQVPEE
jgi:hypothetical protein